MEAAGRDFVVVRRREVEQGDAIRFTAQEKTAHRAVGVQ
jgi:hypothetical protein